MVMKINPLDRIHAPQQVPGIDKGTPGQGDFKRILEQTVEQKEDRRAVSPPGHVMPGPQIVPVISFNDPAYQGVERMLNALERYQHLLGNTQANLRAVEPAVRQVRKEAETLEPLISGMLDSDPLKPIIGEALMTAAKEIARFENGDYVNH
jgi:hypothetical protein